MLWSSEFFGSRASVNLEPGHNFSRASNEKAVSKEQNSGLPLITATALRGVPNKEPEMPTRFFLRVSAAVLFSISLSLLFATVVSHSHGANTSSTAIDATYTVHGVLYGSFPFSDPIRLVSTGSVSHGTLRTFGPFNGFSQDSFIYEPNQGYVGADSFTYHGL